MMHRYPSLPLLRLLTLVALLLSGDFVSSAAELQISPSAVILDRPEASQQILIRQTDASGSIDLTRQATIRIEPVDVATIDDRGLIRPLANGLARLMITVGQSQATIPVSVSRLDKPEKISFQREIIPILTKSRCNSGGCHGKAEGQNGFKLSIFGFDAPADYAAIVRESRGRRVSVTNPISSLLIQKASARMPHGGAQAMEPNSDRERRLLRWIAEGAQFQQHDGVEPKDAALYHGIEPEIVRIEVEPEEQVLLAGETQQLRVSTIDSLGHRQCVTSDSEFESNAPALADVDTRGLIQASAIPGEVTILVHHLGHVATCRVTLPRPGQTFERPSVNNFIDQLTWEKLQRLGIPPSGLCDDATFLRRASLDVIGTLPTPDQVRAFLNDPAANKRQRLIDQLLERDEYADYWTMQWLDILRADQLTISPQGAVAMQRWLRRCFAQNRRFDQWATELLTVQGNTSAEGPGSFYKILNKPDEAARSVSQLLLGVRIECAQCHHHPSERWTQTDYVALAGFFTGLSLKKLPNGEQALVALGGKDLPHPRNGDLVPARVLGGQPADFTKVTDRRQVLADWLTDPQNPFFAKAIANRMWSHYFGRGLIEPIDDIRQTNPATNPALMDALADHMREVDYDLKAFTRTLLNSRLYQISSETLPANTEDHQNFSHYLQRSLPAEVLLDAISQSTGVPEEFNGWPVGYRAIQVWDNHMPSYFFRIFGRPVRATVCECERSDEPSIAQALHLLNSPELFAKIA
ncbi:MAG: DUF1549 domain-containing protein, partial [Pirellulaceae bacterium]|nr:DUF1549 domain-containing protein [Pirellulaceae bacterium]